MFLNASSGNQECFRDAGTSRNVCSRRRDDNHSTAFSKTVSVCIARSDLASHGRLTKCKVHSTTLWQRRDDMIGVLRSIPLSAMATVIVNTAMCASRGGHAHIDHFAQATTDMRNVQKSGPALIPVRALFCPLMS